MGADAIPSRPATAVPTDMPTTVDVFIVGVVFGIADYPEQFCASGNSLPLGIDEILSVDQASTVTVH